MESVTMRDKYLTTGQKSRIPWTASAMPACEYKNKITLPGLIIVRFLLQNGKNRVFVTRYFADRHEPLPRAIFESDIKGILSLHGPERH